MLTHASSGAYHGETYGGWLARVWPQRFCARGWHLLDDAGEHAEDHDLRCDVCERIVRIAIIAIGDEPRA